jgi:hypothetical protein
MSIYKTSRAVIRPADFNQRYIYVLDSENPETRLSEELKRFIEEVGFSSIYSNFSNVTVGNIHPFAILLSQEVLGVAQSTNLFPSITISDSTMDESEEVMSDDYAAIVFTPEDIVVVFGYREAGDIFVSDEGVTKIQEKIDTAGKIIGIKRRFRSRHTLDFNIWSDNKEITSFLFDTICHFVKQKRPEFHVHGMDLGTLNGRRSGDINLDFGTLLYGANIRTDMNKEHVSVVFDTGISSISELDTKTLPNYFDLGGV